MAVDEDQFEKHGFHPLHEAKRLINIALPTVIVQFSLYFLYPQTASAVGRNLGTQEWAAFSLGSLTGNMTCLAIIIGFLSAANTLMPRAYGSKNYEEVGLLAIQSFVVCFLVLLGPMIVLTTSMDWIFAKLGQDPTVSALAVLWLRIYVLGIPFVLLLRVLQYFLSCQHVVWPMAYGCAFGCFIVHPFLLRTLIRHLGFLGSALAIVLTQVLQVVGILLYLWWRPEYNHETWKGLSLYAIREALRLKPMMSFLKLGLAGILSMSEWWFWEVMCMLAGHFGVIPLCSHTIAYNLIPICFMVALGTSIGLTTRMGHILTEDVTKAKLLAATCMFVTLMVACLVATLLWQRQDDIIAMFTNDDQVKQGCKEIWHLLCIYIILLYIFGINMGIMRALGMHWALAGIIILFLWFGALPTVIHFALQRKGGVPAMWHVLPVFYSAMNLAIILSYVTADWDTISASIRNRRASHQAKGMSETTRLLEEQELPSYSDAT
jgi:multidrug resistance protein, MATE family